MGEQLPLAVIQRALREVLRGRDDVAAFGAQAVNAWVNQPRMTQNIDLLALEPGKLAAEICSYLNEQCAGMKDKFCKVNRCSQGLEPIAEPFLISGFSNAPLRQRHSTLDLAGLNQPGRILKVRDL